MGIPKHFPLPKQSQKYRLDFADAAMSITCPICIFHNVGEFVFVKVNQDR